MPLFWALGPAMWSLSAYIWAYWCFGIAFVWSIGAWLTSNFVWRANPYTWSRPQRRQTTASDWKKFYLRASLVPVIVLSGFFGAIYTTHQFQKREELSSIEGRLYPANDPLPSNSCGVGEGSLAVFLGQFVAITNEFPHTVLEVKGEKRIILDRAKDGTLAISLEIRSEDNRIIAKIENGKYMINPNNILGKDRKDRSSLQIVDQFGRQALNIRYFNPRAVWIDAELRYPGSSPILLNGSTLKAGMCLVNNKVSISIG